MYPTNNFIAPNSREAEEALIGSVLINPDVFRECGVTAADFYTHRLGFIWGAFERLAARAGRIDILTTASELEAAGQLADAGGPAGLTALLMAVPESTHADEYADIVRARAAQREQIRIASLIAGKAYRGEEIAPEIDALTKTGWSREISVKDAISQLYDLAEERDKNPSRVWGISTGLIDLDNMTGGLSAQEVTLIAGKPAAGKTTLMLQICLEAARAGHGVAVFEMEMDINNILIRLNTLMGGPTRQEIMRGQISNKEKFYANLAELERLPLEISDRPGMTTREVGASIARLQATKDIELVAVDYLDLLGDADGRDGNEKSLLRSRRFRQVCRERKVSGLSVASLNKTGINSDEPGLADVSGVAGVLFDADNVFMLTTDDDGKLSALYPRKMRYGERVGKIELVRAGMRFNCMARVLA